MVGFDVRKRASVFYSYPARSVRLAGSGITCAKSLNIREGGK